MPSGKYLEKAIEVDSGYKPTVWRCSAVHIILSDTDVAVRLDLRGWKDIDAHAKGGRPVATKSVTIEKAEKLPEYQDVFAVFLSKILADPAFKGAKLKEL